MKERRLLTVHNDLNNPQINLAAEHEATLTGVRALICLLYATDLKVIVAQHLKPNWKKNQENKLFSLSKPAMKALKVPQDEHSSSHRNRTFPLMVKKESVGNKLVFLFLDHGEMFLHPFVSANTSFFGNNYY